MSMIIDVMSGIATALRTVSGLRVEESFEGDINPPVAVVGIPTVTTYHSSMARGHFELEPTITVFTSQVVNRVGQEKLAAYADPSGATSIRAAIEADKTLGGKVSDAHVIGFRPLDLEEYSAFGYFGGIFTMYVITRGDS
jgi:hypothetical protein